MKINLGCGRNILPGWVNLDRIAREGVDVVADLEGPSRLPFDDDSADEMLLSHVLEHITDTLGLMAELYRIAEPDALLTVRVPYGSSDDAWTDQTHVRPWFVGSFGYFSQPFYWRADYAFSADWRCDEIFLFIDKRFKGQLADDIMRSVNTERNVVREMVARLRAVKPAREQRQELQTKPNILLGFA